MGKISTGVDKLVALVHDKQKLTVDEAAKTLGVSKTIVQEWADFLEEEGLVAIKYSLSKTYLVEKNLSKRDVADKEKQFATQRETFIRKVDTTIAQLENETASFEAFKKEFQTIKNEIGAGLGNVEKELDQLRSYESLKTDVAGDLAKQHAVFAKKQEEAEAQIKREYKQYEEVLQAVAAEQKALSAQKARVDLIIKSEQEATQKLDAYAKLIENLRKKASDEISQLGVDEQQLLKLQKNATTIKADLEAIESKTLKPLRELHMEHDVQVRKLEQKIMQKAGEVKTAAKKPGSMSKDLRKKLEEFFKRKKALEDMLHTIEKDRADLAGELKELQQRADAYRLGKTSVRMEELESKLKTVEERKKGLRGHISAFLKLLK
jgi:myosin heavy chain 9/10/11/14